MQENAKIPLIIACNTEGGGNGACTDGTEIGMPVKIGATGDEKYAYEMCIRDRWMTFAQKTQNIRPEFLVEMAQIDATYPYPMPSYAYKAQCLSLIHISGDF